MRRGPGRTATDRSFRATPTSPDPPDDRGAAGQRSAGATSACAAAPRPAAGAGGWGEPGGSWASGRAERTRLATPRAICCRSPVGSDLARDGRGGTAETAGDLASDSPARSPRLISSRSAAEAGAASVPSRGAEPADGLEDAPDGDAMASQPPCHRGDSFACRDPAADLERLVRPPVNRSALSTHLHLPGHALQRPS